MRFISLIIVFSNLCITAYALENDREQPFHIQADNAEINEVLSKSIYRGSVTVDQGSMHIRADEIEIRTDGHEIIQIVARMQDSSSGLAHYEQQPSTDSELIFANAKEINYMIQEQKLHLTGQAKLHQLDNEFAGELLFYDVGKGIVNLKGSLTPDKKPGRINMTINPKKN